MRQIGLIISIVLLGVGFWLWNKNHVPVSKIGKQNQVSSLSENSDTPISAPKVTNENDFLLPLTRAGERVTKKPFGIFITPQNSPIKPENFSGYHAGADFEIFPDELNSDVTVQAICTGKLQLKKYASGYGGVAVESCTVDGKSMTVVYGHLKLASITSDVGDTLRAGDRLGILGANVSAETSGERKHLHLGFHVGTAINILGYVQAKGDLSQWIDPCRYVCHN